MAEPTVTPAPLLEPLALPDKPAAAPEQWYKDAVVYQLHVRSFYDSNDDGVGDFAGLTAKLDYLQELGVTAVWLLPFYPSPLRDDGYDIADYRDVNPVYGTLSDFKNFVQEAHARGLKVITELVINHTSDQHPWFQRARRAAPGTPLRDFYVWSDTPERYQEARIIFKDFEVSNWAWDPLAKAYYWHRFYSHQPDLNFDNPQVCEAVFELLDYWLEMGVDGLRLDAVPYLFEREGTNCENLPETHRFLKELRRRVDERWPGRMLLAEANQWPEDAIAYFGDGDECHTAFHFPVMPRLFMAMHMEDRFPIIDILQQTPAIPDSCQWFMFLRNHDELTLEMVTDEERDYMWRVYARDRQARINLGIRRRLAPLLENNRRQIELMNGLLFSLPGAPVLYYGDEIGMGDNIYLGDRHGVRTPMQWSPDRNAGFSRANPQRLYSPVILDAEYVFAAVNVENQQKNAYSLLWWMRRLIAQRQQHRALSRGSFEPLTPNNPKVLTFVRRFEDECLLVVANLARVAQFVELDLSAFAGRRPIEVFGQTQFPTIGAGPYTLALTPHAFYWFRLTSEKDGAAQSSPLTPIVEVQSHWTELLRGRRRARFEAVLGGDLPRRRWFDGKNRSIQEVRLLGSAALDGAALDGETQQQEFWLVFIRVEYADGDPESYVLPIAHATGEESQRLLAEHADAVILRLRTQANDDDGVLYDALLEPSRVTPLLTAIVGRRRISGPGGEVVGTANALLAELAPDVELLRPSEAPGAETGSDVVFGDKLILKTFRRLELGENPDLELGRALTEARFAGVPPLVGALECYYRPDEEPVTLGVLQAYMPNCTGAFQFTADWLDRFLERIVTEPPEQRPQLETSTGRSLWDLAAGDAPDEVRDHLGSYLEAAAALGKLTADFHLAMAGNISPHFAPEPFSQLYQKSLEQSARKLDARACRQLKARLNVLPPATAERASWIVEHEGLMHAAFGEIIKPRIVTRRIRCHGDYHLGQVITVGKEFWIADFEGRANRDAVGRRIKRSALLDVAAMIRSFHYVAVHVLWRLSQTGYTNPEVTASVLEYWHRWTSSAFLKAYVAGVAGADLLPAVEAHRRLLLRFHLLQRALTELIYDLEHRPEWAVAPLNGVLELLSAEASERGK